MESDESNGRATSLSRAARRHRALGAPTRLHMLQLLERRERTVGELASAVQVSLSAASRHVRLLHDSGLIERTRRGMRVVCRLSPAGAAALADVAPGTGDTSPALELEPSAHGSEAAAEGHDRGDLSTADPEDVDLYLLLGASMLRYGPRDRQAWDPRMVDYFGRDIEPHLPVLHTAALRILAGEAIDDLPLPQAVIARGPELFG